MKREKCPCCGYPTISQRGQYEICRLCDWEDDFQSEFEADKVLGGPNGDYSLAEAKNNFKKNFIMYRSNKKANPKIIEMKKSLMKAYEELEKEHEPQSAWEKIRELEKELDHLH